MCEDNAISVLWEILLVLRPCVYASARMCGFLKEPKSGRTSYDRATPGKKKE